MSRRGNCYDNATMESFWSSLKRELVHRRTFASRAQARAAIFEWIEVFYNRERLHSAPGYKSPVDFENQINQTMSHASPRHCPPNRCKATIEMMRARAGAEIALFISLDEPTKGMIKDAASAGFYESPNQKNIRACNC